MFKLIVALFAIANGTPAAKPSLVVEITGSFESKESCMGFLESDEGKKAKARIEKLADEIEGDVAIKPICKKIDDKKVDKKSDDGKI